MLKPDHCWARLVLTSRMASPSVAPDEVPTAYVIYAKVTGMPMATSFQGTNALAQKHYNLWAFGSTCKEAKQLRKPCRLRCPAFQYTHRLRTWRSMKFGWMMTARTVQNH